MKISANNGIPGVKLDMAKTDNKQHAICALRCKSCGLCVDACPKHVLTIGSELNAAGYAVVVQARPEDCVRCGICGIVCPDAAIGVVEAA